MKRRVFVPAAARVVAFVAAGKAMAAGKDTVIEGETV
jgi:hypothetical protein